MAKSNPLIHESLEGDAQFRLLHLEPGTGDADVHFTLHVADLDEYPEYEAISYCWGDPAATSTVYCQGHPIEVTNSLSSGLKRLRRSDGIRILWADAICINQYDIPERNRQVMLMSRIYAQPSKVLVWLGDDTTGLEGLDECLKGAHEVLPEEVFDPHVLATNSRKVFLENSIKRKENKPNFSDHDWTPFNNLLCRPWFDRRWIIQEVSLSGAAVPTLIICGDVELMWNDLASVAYRLAAYSIVPLISGLSVINYYAPYMASFFAEGARPVHMLSAVTMTYLLKQYRLEANLVDAVIATPLFKCSDPRDHLYSLLSLSPRSSGLVADYSLSVEEVCMNFATATISRDKDLRVLSLAPHTAFMPGGMEPKRLDLPSWVPDLTCQGGINPLVSYTIREQLFHAGGRGTEEEEQPVIRVADDGRILHLRGRIVDKIAAKAICSIDIPFPTDEDILPKTGWGARLKMRQRNLFQNCRDVAADGDWAGKGKELEAAFSEAVLCGMTGMRDPLPQDVVDAVPYYVSYVFDYFDPDWKLTDELRDKLLTYGALIETSLMGVSEGRCFCKTESGRMGQAPALARVGDVFCVVLGAEVPYVLRPHPEKEGTYTLLGDAYLRGVMQGEALTDSRYETVDISIE
ncbi:heterokaryon incompatibility protein-domain-containing protein [Podospora didyma]|uniref:Heterokaryon incompatibility protein-domain-containing protein n=1 Tax=Podospora didyma TaxID=330526 RepID=A0AAE0NQH3_9PEZI|nr:heterokaryon incompatibility protein-domain-containing protein [Podospora didyma]